MLMLGEAGTGKTTLVRTALADLGDSPNRYVLVSNPALERSEFYQLLAAEFGLSPEARTSKTRFLFELQRDVDARFAAGGLTALIIDEAQSMPHALLEEIRLLGNIETPTTKLLNIVLCGQPELGARLNDVSLRQLKQRIALRCELRPLTRDETAAYISARVKVAGGNAEEIFSREAVMAIFEASRGVPRTINVLCDNALIGGFAAQARPIPVNVVADICRDFDIGAAPSPPAATPKRLMGTPVMPSAPADLPRSAPERQVATSRWRGVSRPSPDTHPMVGTARPPRRKLFGIF
jgi:type II secretory pathway predicted ATPase ExeA